MYQYQDGLIPPGQETFGAMPMPRPPANFHHNSPPTAVPMPPQNFNHGSPPYAAPIMPPAPPYTDNFQSPPGGGGGDYNDRPPPYFVQGEDFHQTPIIPPQTSAAPTAPTLSGPTIQRSTVAIPPMAEEDVRHILENYVNSECCYGKDPVTQMNIRDISNIPVFRYQLETFTEKRVGTWKTVPYGGTDQNAIGGMTSGIPANLWEYVAVPDVRFQKGKKVFELPHTASICSCPRCQGSGRVQCNGCGGCGSTPCSSCSGMGNAMTTSPDGSGNMVMRPCTWCGGTGRSNCSRCQRRGVRTCSTCEGKYRVKTYYELQVIWNCTAEACVSVDGDLNSSYRKYFKRKGGFCRVASQTSTWAQPLDNFPDQGVQAASRSMLEGSVRGHQNSVQRIIEFRQTVLEVPCTLVRFTWKGKEDLFLISSGEGSANSVHFPNSYPQGCCSIL